MKEADSSDEGKTDSQGSDSGGEDALSEKNVGLEDFDEGQNEIVRRSTRVKSKPRYLNDYATLAMIAHTVDILDRDDPCEIQSNFVSLAEKSILNECESSVCFNAISFSNDVPQAELEERDDGPLWQVTVEEELLALNDNETWEVVSLPSGKVPMKCKWVFTVKPDGDGNIERLKARLVVKGCSQKKGIDYNETYAPVAGLSTVRALLCHANRMKYAIIQLDVRNAFLNGVLTEEIFMWPSEGSNIEKGKVCRLKKTLYGLKQAPMEWNRRFDDFIKGTLNFVQCESDKCLYILKGFDYVIFVLLYVDDFVLVGSDENVMSSIKSKLMHEFKMKDLGNAKYFLGVIIEYLNGSMFLSQSAYLKGILRKFNMENCASAKTPMEIHPNQEVGSSKCIIGIKPYRELIGCLMYACIGTRPDIFAAVNFYSQFQSNATEIQWKGLKRVLRYLKGTINWGFRYRGEGELAIQSYVDANFAYNLDGKSVTGYLVEMYGDLVSWGTKKQSTVARSSTEAEYVALTTASAEVLWLKQLLNEMCINVTGCIPIYEDNQSCIHVLNSWSQSSESPRRTVH